MTCFCLLFAGWTGWTGRTGRTGWSGSFAILGLRPGFLRGTPALVRVSALKASESGVSPALLMRGLPCGLTCACLWRVAVFFVTPAVRLGMLIVVVLFAVDYTMGHVM